MQLKKQKCESQMCSGLSKHSFCHAGVMALLRMSVNIIFQTLQLMSEWHHGNESRAVNKGSFYRINHSFTTNRLTVMETKASTELGHACASMSLTSHKQTRVGRLRHYAGPRACKIHASLSFQRIPTGGA